MQPHTDTCSNQSSLIGDPQAVPQQRPQQPRIQPIPFPPHLILRCLSLCSLVLSVPLLLRLRQTQSPNRRRSYPHPSLLLCLCPATQHPPCPRSLTQPPQRTRTPSRSVPALPLVPPLSRAIECSHRHHTWSYCEVCPMFALVISFSCAISERATWNGGAAAACLKQLGLQAVWRASLPRLLVKKHAGLACSRPEGSGGTLILC